MLRSRSVLRAAWLLFAITSSVGACAEGTNDGPGEMLGYSGTAGTGGQGDAGATKGGSTNNGGSGGSSLPGGGHGGFIYGGTGGTAPAGGVGTSGNSGSGGAGSGGTQGVSGSAGSGGTASQGGSNNGGSPSGGSGGSNNGGSSNAGSNTGGSNTGGSGGSPPVVIYDRDYQFDSTVTPFGLSQYGSTPNIGMAGGPEKLSAQSTLSQTTQYGSPNKGSAKLVIPFSQYGEQLDMHAGFDGARENWTGYSANARIKIVSGGNADGSCPLQAWIYITSGSDYIFGRGTTVNITSNYQDLTYDFAAPAEGLPDLTIVNQLGIQVFSNNCGGTPSFSDATIIIDNFQVHKP